VAAVEEGRVTFENIRKVVAYVLSNSFAEVLTIFTAMLFRWPAPLAVAQILWIHLICDGLRTLCWALSRRKMAS
jgi:P-type Ca2+ transporter type 2C